MTLVVNLFGGPGTGKSTTASLIFGHLKSDGYKAELVHEFAKDLTWEKRDAALKYQPYIFGKQSYHVHRLLGQTDVVITDSPILLSSHVYSDRMSPQARIALMKLGEATFASWNTLNVFLRRNQELHPFVQAGRNQDEQESISLDAAIIGMLDELEIGYFHVEVGDSTAVTICQLIKQQLARK